MDKEKKAEIIRTLRLYDYQDDWVKKQALNSEVSNGRVIFARVVKRLLNEKGMPK